MPEQKLATRQCPFCKEDVKIDAIRCKHCQATIPPERPAHQGVCPFCKESINPDAIRCKHCKAILTLSELEFFFQGPSPGDFSVPFQMRARATLRPPIIFGLPRSGAYADNAGAPKPKVDFCDGCPPGWMEGSTMYGVIACDEKWCYYGPVGYV